jgi:DNA-binding transcriptional LysR family regulator
VDLHQLKVFVSVYRNRSFSKASTVLFLTQPTVSDHIRSIEEELQCRLFDRLGRTIIPTGEADVLYSEAVELLEKAEAIKTAISRLKHDIRGEILIGASTIPGTYLMPRIVASFRSEHPSVTFCVPVSDSKDIIDRVGRHEFLVGIVGVNLAHPQIRYSPFMEDQLMAVASPDFAVQDRISKDELPHIPMVLREPGSGTRREVEQILEREGIAADKLAVSGVFGSTDAVREAVREGLGIAILSRLSVKDDLERGALREVALPGIRMKRLFYIITHRKRTLPQLYVAFLDHLRTREGSLMAGESFENIRDQRNS